MVASTLRFSHRVENYIRFRPGYPDALVDLLCREARLESGSVAVDLGSGTGILARMLLARQVSVHAVEPNAGMREAAEGLLGGDPRFISHATTAEHTGLPGHCADLITAAQAFHWFDRALAKLEFNRLLKPGAVAALIWNERQVTRTPFLREYETFLETWATDYQEVNHANITPAEITAFFAPHPVRAETFPNQQVFDYAGLEGRLMSCSYAPAEDDPRHAPMLAALHALFERHAQDGKVCFEYDCRVWWARNAPEPVTARDPRSFI